MGDSIKYIAEQMAEHARAVALAAEEYPEARHVEGRVWEVDSMDDANHIIVNKDGAWRGRWVGREDEGGGVFVRVRHWDMPPWVLLMRLIETDEGKALLMKLLE